MKLLFLVGVCVLMTACDNGAHVAKNIETISKQCNDSGGKSTLTLTYSPTVIGDGAISLVCEGWKPK